MLGKRDLVMLGYLGIGALAITLSAGFATFLRAQIATEGGCVPSSGGCCAHWCGSSAFGGARRAEVARLLVRGQVAGGSKGEIARRLVELHGSLLTFACHLIHVGSGLIVVGSRLIEVGIGLVVIGECLVIGERVHSCGGVLLLALTPGEW